MFINWTESIGIVVGNATTYTTGSIFLTLLTLLIILLAIALMFGIPLEYTSIGIFPLLVAYMAYYKDFWSIGAVIFIYMAFILTKNWLFK